MNKYYLLIITLFSFPLFAIDEKPWFGNDKELLAQAHYQYISANSLKLGNNRVNYDINDSMFGISAALSPLPAWNFQTAGQFIYSEQNSFMWDALALSAQYSLWNDVTGDLFSVITGLNLSIPSWESLHNISTPHYGEIEGKAYVSIGKEYTRGPFWIWRGWTSAGIGVANRGSPYLEATASIARNFNDFAELEVYALVNTGLASGNLSAITPFSGYGDLRHQNLDIGINATYNFPSYGTLQLGYAHRVYAKNFPDEQNLWILSFSFPIQLTKSIDF